MAERTPGSIRNSHGARLALALAAGLIIPAHEVAGQPTRPLTPTARPGQAGASSPLNPAGATPPRAAGTTPAAQRDPNALPPSFEPPGEVSPLLSIEKELLTEDEETQLKRDVGGGYVTVLRTGTLDSQARAQLPKIARLVIHSLSMKKYRDTLPEKQERLMREISQTAVLQKNPQIARQFREAYLKEVAARAAELMDGNLRVRMTGAIILASLYVVEPTRETEGEAFLGALEPLVQLLENKDQPDAVKIHAAKGIERIAATARPSASQKLRMSQVLIDELQRTDTHPWYQMRLAETLGSVDYPTDNRGRPTIASALTSVVADNDRHCLVRSQAARSLGRVPLDAQVNVANIAFSISHFASQMAEEYNKAPGAAQWRVCYFNVYLAFKPLNAAERSRNAGLLAKVDRAPHTGHRAAVNEAYQQVLPLARHAINATAPTKIPEAHLTSLAEWLKTNQPVDYRVAPNTPPIATQQVSKPDEKPAG